MARKRFYATANTGGNNSVVDDFASFRAALRRASQFAKRHGSSMVVDDKAPAGHSIVAQCTTSWKPHKGPKHDKFSKTRSRVAMCTFTAEGTKLLKKKR